MRYLVLFSLIFLTLFGSDKTYEHKIYKSIVESIFPNKKVVYIWTDLGDESYLFATKNIQIVATKEKADILIIKKTEDIKSDKIKFALSYRVFNSYFDDIIGGFYWQKGRPNLIFLGNNLKKHNIKLTTKMREFIEDNI